MVYGVKFDFASGAPGYVGDLYILHGDALGEPMVFIRREGQLALGQLTLSGRLSKKIIPQSCRNRTLARFYRNCRIQCSNDSDGFDGLPGSRERCTAERM